MHHAAVVDALRVVAFPTPPKWCTTRRVCSIRLNAISNTTEDQRLAIRGPGRDGRCLASCHTSQLDPRPRISKDACTKQKRARQTRRIQALHILYAWHAHIFVTVVSLRQPLGVPQHAMTVVSTAANEIRPPTIQTQQHSVGFLKHPCQHDGHCARCLLLSMPAYALLKHCN